MEKEESQNNEDQNLKEGNSEITADKQDPEENRKKEEEDGRDGDDDKDVEGDVSK